MSARIPFAEQKSPLRGAVELACGAYPGFIFGLPVSRDILPTFHFHEVTPALLEPALAYLRENGYRTVLADDVARFVRGNGRLPPRAVALTFDDAWASAWTVATPLLRRYEMLAILFVAPGRVPEGSGLRPTLDDPGGPPADVDRSDTPFCTWSELRAMRASGCWDIQAHSYAHAMIFFDSRVTGFVTPAYSPHIHLSPNVGSARSPRFLTAADLGAPLHPMRSRLSDALRYDDEEAREECLSLVRAEGGAAFFERPDWQARLARIARKRRGRTETPAERNAAIREDLAAAKDILESRLGREPVRHLCFPWTIAGSAAERISAEVGYESAYADALGSLRAPRRGGNPYRIMRLKSKFIFNLPGRGRRSFWSLFSKQ
ncbi:MAG: polysaccharide deacetylase family protein [Kiritimatiellae bacterium]|nr:polysaccharide deacetylase family protein [Kiritimatiellia bacterium]MDW8457755.1 polysaccharide deacetylase family protein [Verrucomicrobiota bacterium]